MVRPVGVTAVTSTLRRGRSGTWDVDVDVLATRARDSRFDRGMPDTVTQRAAAAKPTIKPRMFIAVLPVRFSRRSTDRRSAPIQSAHRRSGRLGSQHRQEWDGLMAA